MAHPANKNILFFQNSILPEDGGVPRVSDIISKELSKRGYHCFFVYYDKDNNHYEKKIKLHVDVNKSYASIESQVLSFIEENKIDVFICQNTYSNLFIKLFRKIRQANPTKPFLCFLHASPNYWQAYKLHTASFAQQSLSSRMKKLAKTIIYPFYNPYLRTTTALYEICDRFILLSDSFKQSFFEIYPVDKQTNKLHAIPNPLTFESFISKEEIALKEKTVLIVGRLNDQQKKISVALRIWQLIPAEERRGWKLLIVGGGPDEFLYKDFVQKNNLDNVEFAGQQSNVIDYYKKASIFIMTSVWEGLPMSLLEANQNGVVPIVFDNFSAVHDVVTDGKTGFVAHDNNINQFAEKLIVLMHNEKLLQEMAVNAVESSKRFKATSIVDEWEVMINQEF